MNDLARVAPPLDIADDPRVRVECFLAQFPDGDRADGVTLVLRALRGRINADLALLAEYAYEAHVRGYWSVVKDEVGRPYLSESEFFERVLGLGAFRSIYRYIAAGRLITSVPPAERDEIRRAVSDIGVSKIAILAPVVARAPEEREQWFDRARHESVEDLQRHVTAAVGGEPRGEALAPGERFRAYLLNAMPDLESREALERCFRLGRRAVESDHPVAIFLAMVRAFEVDLAAQGITE